MKENFYVHNTDKLVNLKNDSFILKSDWGKRHLVKYKESIIYHEIYTRKDYFRKFCIIKPGDIVVDCGGNIGIFTSMAFDMGASRVLSFEPFLINYEINKKNNPNAEVFNLAVFDNSDEEIELLYTESNNGGHTIIQSEINNKELITGHYKHKDIFVKTINLNDIISRNFIEKIDFLKIDTEGAELKIIDGISDEKLNKIRNISLEYHNSVFNFDENIYNNFLNRFIKLGFNTYTWKMDKYTRMIYITKEKI